jgi:hypothetical protein
MVNVLQKSAGCVLRIFHLFLMESQISGSLGAQSLQLVDHHIELNDHRSHGNSLKPVWIGFGKCGSIAVRFMFQGKRTGVGAS